MAAMLLSLRVAAAGLFALCALAAASEPASLFPPRFCARMPELLSKPALALIRDKAPELSSRRLRWVDEAAARELVESAIENKRSTIELFTDEGLRGDCVYYFSAPTLQALDKDFDLELLSPITGTDKAGKSFSMRALIAGARTIVVVYDRDGIEHRWNETLRRLRWLWLGETVRHRFAAWRRLEPVEGIEIDSENFLVGYTPVTAFRVYNGKAQIKARGDWHGDGPSTPIKRHPSLKRSAIDWAMAAGRLAPWLDALDSRAGTAGAQRPGW